MPFASALSQGANSTSPSNTLYIGQFKSLLIVGTSMKAVEGVAAHLNGGANPALNQNAQFAADQLSQFHNAPLYYGWFNAKTFFSVLSQMQPGRKFRPMAVVQQHFDGFRIKGLKERQFQLSRDHAKVRKWSCLPAAPESTRRGLLKMFTAASKDANPPPFVPADAVQFFRWRVDGQKAWTELEKTLSTLSPGMMTNVNSMFMMANANAQQQNPNFDMRKNLIGNLGDDWIKFAKAPAGNTLARFELGTLAVPFCRQQPRSSGFGH